MEYSTYLPNFGNGDAGVQTDRIKADPDALLTKASDVSARLTELQTLANDIDQIVRGTSSYWIGEAADFQREMFTSVAENAEGMFERVSTLAARLEAIANNYIEAGQHTEDLTPPLPGDILK